MGTYNYTYDALGNVTGISGALTRSYTYDSLGQLTSVTAGSSTTNITYDTNGNILTRGDDVYTYGNADWPDQLTAYNGRTYTYDAIGNATSWRLGMTFTWQKGRQLSSVTRSGETYNYTYDSSGVRKSKTVDGVTTNFTYVDGKLIHQTDGTNIWWFYYDSDGTMLAMKYNDNMYFYQFDGLGNIVGLVDVNGAVVAEYVYDAWGRMTSRSGSMNRINPFKFKGYYYDEETQIYYLMSRYYDPIVGRFINADSFASTGQGVLGYNMYAYCGNNPIMNCDPNGNSWARIGQALFGAAMVAAAVAAVVVAAPVVAAAVAAATITSTAVLAGGTVIAAGATFVCGSSIITEAVTGNNPVANVIGRENFDALATFSFACTTYGLGMLVDMTCVTTPSTTTSTTTTKGTSNYNLDGAKSSSYVANRGWSDNMINTAIETGKRGTAINRANEAACTAYLYPGTKNQYVVIENTSRSVVQVSDFFDTGWIVDSSIKWD